MEVALKECEEIAQIFSAYDIFINKVETEYIPYKIPEKKPSKITMRSSNITSGIVGSPDSMAEIVSPEMPPAQ